MALECKVQLCTAIVLMHSLCTIIVEANVMMSCTTALESQQSVMQLFNCHYRQYCIWERSAASELITAPRHLASYPGPTPATVNAILQATIAGVGAGNEVTSTSSYSIASLVPKLLCKQLVYTACPN